METTTATNEVKGPIKPRFVFQHVWKTGGTELCKLARANGWNLPDTPGCTVLMHPHQGWPTEDFDMVGNEAAIPSGEVDYIYKPRKVFEKNEGGRLTVEVKWLTTLRHPYSRTLSHYHHLKRLKVHENLTLDTFLTTPGPGSFGSFITNHQTRWHCGTGPCANNRNMIVTKAMLEHAIGNLNKMHAVLILEDMSSPQSCTRRQMRHLLNFTKVESFSDDNAPASRSSRTSWEKAIRPYLDQAGRGTNETMLTGFGSSPDNTTRNTMAALGMHNDMDLQLYGYAQHLCEVLADKYDQQANASSRANALSFVNLANATVSVRPNPKKSDVYLTPTEVSTMYLSTIHILMMTLMLVVCSQHVCKWRRKRCDATGQS